MREILFRGETAGNEWIYGNLIIIGDCCFISEGMGFQRTVAPETVGQYTGLKDKNGKRIFEGDIVKHDFGEDQIGVQYAVIKYSDIYAAFMIKPLHDWMFCCKSDCEVIGNIHDNPELLEVTNDKYCCG